MFRSITLPVLFISLLNFCFYLNDSEFYFLENERPEKSEVFCCSKNTSALNFKKSNLGIKSKYHSAIPAINTILLHFKVDLRGSKSRLVSVDLHILHGSLLI